MKGLIFSSTEPTSFSSFNYLLLPGERKWVERNGSNRPPVPWVESSPFRNCVEWTWVDLEKCQVQGRQHIDFDPSPFDPIRPQSIRPKLFDQKGRVAYINLNKFQNDSPKKWKDLSNSFTDHVLCNLNPHEVKYF